MRANGAMQAVKKYPVPSCLGDPAADINRGDAAAPGNGRINVEMKSSYTLIYIGTAVACCLGEILWNFVRGQSLSTFFLFVFNKILRNVHQVEAFC
jgi:hypothetical protein